ncbi:molecular chaperone DnaJ [Patescibacteria group bacterium]|nr:molecular chaperone DnaJ [Patescibacteria group bacterium]MBU1663543.1 molecular chaperone DnaJ [Patescibacteria group bacterium]MBU1933805.1 molecular chaperone DnaJ [Patescibacteria group bacterium]MBU2007803.1 molecular chaperone DnaJ [Patescibacteria group bacterium]MBU2233447.1 molecular chaperone DnaJ [Patescibacteria group bacterium]
MSKDYYHILGVDKNVSQDEIKKAFRALAHQHHPDKKSGDEVKFKEINEAYQVLSDQKKRSQYDQFGSTFEQAQAEGGFHGFDGFRDFTGATNGFNINMDDLGDIFSGLGDVFGFSGGSSRHRRQSSKRGSDIQVLLTIDFSQAVFGVEKEISLKKTVKCSECQGDGRKPGAEVIVCKTCGGKGRVIRVQRTILGNMQTQMECEACRGEGKIFKEKCSACHGAGLVHKIVNLKVKIPAGIDNNETIRLSGQGEAAAKGAQDGDLYLKIRVNSGRGFERDGVNIKSRAQISFSQAALGDKIEVATVDGHVELKIPEGTQSGRVFILRNKGVPYLNRHGRGDHLVEVIVKTPINLTRKQKELLKEFGL